MMLKQLKIVTTLWRRLWSGHVDVGSVDQQQQFLLKRLQVCSLPLFFQLFSPNVSPILDPLQLQLDDAKLLGWLKCLDCANAAKKARAK
jgi:hypothetical protein